MASVVPVIANHSPSPNRTTSISPEEKKTDLSKMNEFLPVTDSTGVLPRYHIEINEHPSVHCPCETKKFAERMMKGSAFSAIILFFLSAIVLASNKTDAGIALCGTAAGFWDCA